MADLWRWVMIASRRIEATRRIRVAERGCQTIASTFRGPALPVLLRLLGRDPWSVPPIGSRHGVALAVVVSLVAAPIAAAVGTAVYEPRRYLYAEQAETRHTVVATVTDVPDSPILRGGITTVSARWTAAGAEHTGAVEALSTTKTGDPVEIWIDHSGAQVPAPTPTIRAAVEAVASGLAIWISVAAIAVTLYNLTRAVCDRIRFTGWQHSLDNLVDDGDGYQYPGRPSQQ